jgi:hypothetical protein
MVRPLAEQLSIPLVLSRIICRASRCRQLGRRVSDEFTVPLCLLHHRELHRWVTRLHMLIDIALCEDLFHTATGTAFADILVGGH